MYHKEYHWLAASFLLLMVIFGAYIYFVSASIAHVVISKEIDQKIAAVNAEISESEAAYIKLQYSISSEVAKEKGFILATDKIYTTRAGDALVLSQTEHGNDS